MQGVALLSVTSAMPMQCINELVQWARYAKGMGGSSGSKFGIPFLIVDHGLAAGDGWSRVDPMM